MKRIWLWATIFLLYVSFYNLAPALEPVGVAQMEAFERLPFFKEGVKVKYEGSIDKKGYNADWDWWLYQEGDGWVIFDVDGPGCIYNFVQHRYPTSPEPTFKFYFDGETEPRFIIKLSEFGKKPPFVEPLAGIYSPTPSGPIWVIRSFVPMPFEKSCKVTSSEKLLGNQPGGGGWGHIVYHTYQTAEGVTTFTGNEDYSRLLNLWQNVGKDPKDTVGNEITTGSLQINPASSATILNRTGKESIASIKMNINPFSKERLKSMWIRIYWDGGTKPSVNVPLGAFFGNELGYNDMQYLLHGMSTTGIFYNYFPMPYWQSARIEIYNGSRSDIVNLSWEIHVKPSDAYDYPQDRCGYFKVIYTPRTHTVKDRDTQIGRIRGKGHMVAGLVTAHSEVWCEGDVRVHIDRIATPQVESDGSESWSCYGNGFVTPPENNPSSGYDGKHPPNAYDPPHDGTADRGWSMVRLLTGDWYPFQAGLNFNIEHGGYNEQPYNFEQSGAIFYYGIDEAGMVLTDSLDVGNPESEQAHNYKIVGQTYQGELEAYYEGDDDDVLIKDNGRAFNGYSEFTIAIRPDNNGVRLRRRCDQKDGRQRAKVYVDDTLTTGGTWYYADRNPFKRWLEDEFEIPASYTKGKDKIKIKIEYVPAGDATEWNEYFYWVYSYVRTGMPPQNIDWYTINAEAIRETRFWHVNNQGDIYFTKAKDADTVYAFFTRPFWERGEQQSVILHSVGTTETTEVQILHPPGISPSVSWDQTDEGLKISGLNDPRLYDNSQFPKPVTMKVTHATPFVPSPLTEGKFGKAARFYGDGNKRLTIPSWKPKFSPEQLTVELWAKLTSSSEAQVLIARGPKTAGHWELWAHPSVGYLTCYAPDLNPSSIDSNFCITDNQWHFISLRIRPGQVTLAVDGEVKKDQIVTGLITSSEGPISVGALTDGFFPITGAIDDLRLSNVYRSSVSIPASPQPVDENTIGLYPFDELPLVQPEPVETTVLGKFGEAAWFDGDASKRFTIPRLWEFDSPELSIEFWAELPPSGAVQVLVARGPKSTGHWELWTLSTGHVSYYIPDLSPNRVDSSISITDNQWHFIALRMRAGQVSVAIDGNIAIDQMVTGSIASSGESIDVAALPDAEWPHQFPMTGAIDDLRLSNVYRSSLSVPTHPLPADENTIGLYPFDNGNSGLPDIWIQY